MVSKGSDPALAVEVLKQFRVVFRSVRKHFQSVEKELGISGAQLWALSEVQSKPGLTLAELATAMSLHQSTTSNLLEKLIVAQLVEKKRSSQDGRSIRIFPTHKGGGELAKAPLPFKGLLPDALERMPEQDLRGLYEALSLLLATMNQIEPEAAETNPLSEN